MIKNETTNKGGHVALLLGASLIFSCVVEAKPTLIVSEFMAANDAVLKDEAGDFTDWIELHNYGTEAIDIGGVYLTDSRKDLKKFVLPALNLAPGDYALFWAKGEEQEGRTLGSQTNFRLQVKGDYLALIDRDGESVIQDFGEKYPDQKTNVSFGITGDWSPGRLPIQYSAFLLEPTPGAANSGPLLGTVKSVSL
ncbi:lamin tail domain-containing protein, partial [Verrucomicrobia bacterium]|nr:lamin tail domain-containing protein [Verrucomicrobiota bacterium]